MRTRSDCACVRRACLRSSSFNAIFEEAREPMARIRHIALVVKDLEKTADFYQKALGLSRSEMSEGPTARRIYMSDGEVNLALLQYKSEVGSGLKEPQDFVGVHHFGFQVDDLKE